MKKVLIISLILLGITLLFLGVYNVAFKKGVSKTAEPVVKISEEANKQTETVSKKQEKIKNISGQAITGKPFFDKKNETLKYYSAEDGTLWSAGENSKKQISDTELTGLIDVFWSENGKKAITKFKKDDKTFFYFYDHEKQEGLRLKDGIDTITWDLAGNKVFYKYYDPSSDKRTLNISNPDGTEWKSLADLAIKYVSITQIPTVSLLSFWNAPAAEEETQLQTVGLAGGEVQTIFKGRYGADYLWSPDGKQALISSLANKDGKMVTLGLVTLEGSYTELNIPTMVSKCVWSSDGKFIYYALPGGIPDGAVMPNDYQTKRFVTQDTFWKLDITTGKKERIIEASDITEKYDSSQMLLSENKKMLYFVNRIDGKIYSIEL